MSGMRNAQAFPKRRYNIDFGHALAYLLKLQIDHVVLDWHGLGWPKEAFKTYISRKLFQS